MDINVFLDPVDQSAVEVIPRSGHRRLGDLIQKHTGESFPDLSKTHIAIFGVDEDRRAFNNKGCALAPNKVRSYLYRLYGGDFRPAIADLGNIKRGHSVEDTYFAVSSVISELITNNILPVIIGGSQDLTFANYVAYEKLGQVINIVNIDPMFDIGANEEEFTSRSFFSKIILHQPNYLFNYTNLGFQSYFVDPDAIGLMRNMLFDVYRVGMVRQELEEVEPIVRNADMISVDISAVRHSDAPGNGNASPNGFYGEEICRIMRYAGMSDKLSSIGLYEINPELDPSGNTCHLAAQMIWYFIDGYYHRMNDFPVFNENQFLKYTVTIKDRKDELVFYKSKKSDRWWMDVPVSTSLQDIYERHRYVPCSYKDYRTACKDDIPDRWWQAHQKMM